MARIKADSIEAVKVAADMLDVVGTRTQLKKSGARYVGRCPFHEERTGSFSVNAVDKLFYCFGCGKGGDLISFVRETENVDFAGAIEWLADRFRVPIEYEEVSPRQDAERRHRERLYALLEQAAAFYERVLWDSSQGEGARAYLTGRGLGEAVCREYRLGLSPLTGRALAEGAAAKGFTPAELQAAGLVNRRGNDYFTGRLMFPLTDARGRVLGFQARRLREDDPLQAKYVNSPESDLFQKGAIVYGLDRARSAIAKQDRAVVVEGNTDVLALRQAGHEPVVASMGTALTERQLKELSRLTHRLWLCFDGDAAGEAATLRGMELARRQGFSVQVVAFESGSDPADDPAGFEERLREAASYPLHGVRVICTSPLSDQEKLVRVREFLTPIEESLERQEAQRFAADQLGLPAELQAGLAPRGHGAGAPLSEKVLARGDRLERDALAGCVRNRSLVSLLAELSVEHFDEEAHRALRAHLVDDGEPTSDLVPLLAELDARAAEEEIDEATTKELLLRLRERGLRRELAGMSGDLARAKELQEQLARVRAAAGSLA